MCDKGTSQAEGRDLQEGAEKKPMWLELAFSSERQDCRSGQGRVGPARSSESPTAAESPGGLVQGSDSVQYLVFNRSLSRPCGE